MEFLLPTLKTLKPIKTPISGLFGIDYPLIQGGMIWAAGWELVSAVSNAGGLGLLGSGSMQPEVFMTHLRKTRKACEKPFGVNIPLMYKHAPDIIDITISEGIPIVFTSAGNPAKVSEIFRKAGVKWVHCIPSVKMALKAQDAGVDAVVAEGTEAGGHNGFDGTTTFCLVPQVVDAVDIPVIAAGGIADVRGFRAAFALGAQGVQIGTRFAAAKESSAADAYKEAVANAKDTDTYMGFASIGPVRMIKTPFAMKLWEKESSGASKEQLHEFHGRGRGKKGIFLGDGDEGMFEAGQSSGLVKEIVSAKQVIDELVSGWWKSVNSLWDESV